MKGCVIMRLRPYIHSKDYIYLEKWVREARIHSLWCAGIMPFPLNEQGLLYVLEREGETLCGSAYTATDESGCPLGFFVYSLDTENNKGFFKFVVTDNEKRGQGYGRRMLELALKYASEIGGAKSAQLNVFDANYPARKLYTSLGFVQDSVLEDAMSFADEVWAKCHMEIKL